MLKRSIKKIELSKESRKYFNLPLNDENTAAIVTINDGSKYIASFFSYHSIERLRIENARSNEYLGGKYFWKKGMLLIDKCSIDNIKIVIEDILEEGNFEEIFSKIN